MKSGFGASGAFCRQLLLLQRQRLDDLRPELLGNRRARRADLGLLVVDDLDRRRLFRRRRRLCRQLDHLRLVVALALLALHLRHRVERLLRGDDVAPRRRRASGSATVASSSSFLARSFFCGFSSALRSSSASSSSSCGGKMSAIARVSTASRIAPPRAAEQRRDGAERQRRRQHQRHREQHHAERAPRRRGRRTRSSSSAPYSPSTPPGEWPRSRCVPSARCSKIADDTPAPSAAQKPTDLHAHRLPLQAAQRREAEPDAPQIGADADERVDAEPDGGAARPHQRAVAELQRRDAEADEDRQAEQNDARHLPPTRTR